jgi:hypothetical protein
MTLGMRPRNGGANRRAGGAVANRTQPDHPQALLARTRGAQPRRPVSASVRPQEEPMKRTWTIIGVADVARSLKWYQSLFGQKEWSPK